MNTIAFQLTEIDTVAHTVLSKVRKARVAALYGSLGAGKTTLMRALAGALGVTQPVTSPTFAYVNRYKTTSGQNIYHFDLYRLRDVNSFYEAGFDEYLCDEQALVFIEWPEVIESILPAGTIRMYLAHDPRDANRRTLTIQ